MIFIVLAAICWLIWYYNDDHIRDIVRWVRYGEMWIVKLFVDLCEWAGLIDEESYRVMFNGQPVSWESGFEATPDFNKLIMNYQHMSYMTALTMQPMKIPMMAIFCGAGVWVLFHGPGTSFREKMGIEELLKRQSTNFPVISPFVDFNPGNQPPRPPGSPVPAELPCFAEALGPEEWIAYNSIPVPDGKLDEAKAERAFMRQLGKRWRGWQHLEPYQQVMLAAFCLKAQRKRDDADAMLGRLANCWTFKGGLKLNRKLMSEARGILKNEKLAKDTLRKCNQFAFTATALMGALDYARSEGGVMAPAQFVWLRGHDRNLWYPLNNLGRHSYHMEGLGAMSHYKREKRTQRPIPVPKMEDALEMLRDYAASKKMRPIPALDYKGSKKRGIKKAV